MFDDPTTTTEPSENWTPDFWAAFTIWSNEQQAQQREESAAPALPPGKGAVHDAETMPADVATVLHL